MILIFVASLNENMKLADEYIFVSPEYNYSLPPVLVNTVAWISRVRDNFRELFTLRTDSSERILKQYIDFIK